MHDFSTIQGETKKGFITSRIDSTCEMTKKIPINTGRKRYIVSEL